MDSQFSIIALTLLAITAFGLMVAKDFIWKTFIMPRTRKKFLMKEMRHCLQTREKTYGAAMINHCRTILHNLELHCSMNEHFKQTYTYGEFDIGVNWYPIDGRFEFVVPSAYETIARIHYPG